MKALKTVALVIAIILWLTFIIGFVDGVRDTLSDNNQPVSKVETKTETKPEVKETPKVKDDSEVTLESDKYETELPGAREIFVNSCAVDGTTESDCACMYDWLDNNLTNAGFDEVIKDSVDGIISDNMWSAAKACVTI